MRAIRKEYYKDNAKDNAEDCKVYSRQFSKNHRENINEKKRTRRKVDFLFNLTENLRRLTSEAFTENGYKKNSHTYEILGCSYEEALAYIELLWSLPKNLDACGNVWMNWENYGKYNGQSYFGWDIDHKIPIAGNSEEMVYKLSRYTNLQPLCSYVNRDIKRNKFVIIEKIIK